MTTDTKTTMRARPLGDRVVVEQLSDVLRREKLAAASLSETAGRDISSILPSLHHAYFEQASDSGVLLPDGVSAKPDYGVVVAIGPGSRGRSGDREPVDELKVGDIVIYSHYAGTVISVGEDRYLVMREHDIFAVIEE